LSFYYPPSSPHEPVVTEPFCVPPGDVTGAGRALAFAAAFAAAAFAAALPYDNNDNHCGNQDNPWMSP